ncbi:MAG: hypothetical protein OSB82_14985 [Alphaproteobacteria bacterium]|nr:hypothetical protein [Alphaproteobacteria bacterium]
MSEKNCNPCWQKIHVKRAAVEWQISSIAFHPFNIATRRAWEVCRNGQSTRIEIQASDPAGGSNNWRNEPRDGAGTASYIQYLAAAAEFAQVDKVGRPGEEYRGYQQAFIQLARVFFEIPWLLFIHTLQPSKTPK